MNESHKFVPAELQARAREQGTVRPQRPYRRPQAHDLGSLEQVQGGVRVAVRDGPGTISWWAR
jgi:hypothetical protein